MPCHPSHTYGPGLDEYMGTEAEKAQQEADLLREVEESRQMVTDDPPPQPTLNLPYVRGVEQHRVLNYSYWNANGIGIAIVAKEGEVADWAAYIGGDNGWSTEDCVEWTIRHGCKLSRLQANRWFPALPIERYRE